MVLEDSVSLVRVAGSHFQWRERDGGYQQPLHF